MKTKWDIIAETLENDGWLPYHNAHEHNAVILHPCEKDQGTMDYYGYMKANRYKAFAVCRKCGNVIEF